MQTPAWRVPSVSPSQFCSTQTSDFNDSPKRSTSALTLPLYNTRSPDKGPYNPAAIQKRLAKVVVADYSYKDLASLVGITDVEPRSCQYYKPPVVRGTNPSEEISERKRSASILLAEALQIGDQDPLYYFGDRRAAKTRKTMDNIVVIHAKDEEYAFKDEVRKKIRPPKGYRFDAEGRLVQIRISSADRLKALENSGTLIKCTALKLNCNNIREIPQADVIQGCLFAKLFRPHQYLTLVDLSGNKIAAIPQDCFDGFPIATLLLHSNQLQTMDHIKSVGALRRTLKSLTLFDNPLQRKHTKQYRSLVLCELPFLCSLDDVRVTEKERKDLVQFVEVFFPRKDRDAAKRSILPPIQNHARRGECR
jgi:hypothetical protein